MGGKALVSATETDVLDDTLGDDESLDEGFDAPTEEQTTEETPDPVAELRAEIASLKQSVAGIDPARVQSELGRIRSLQSAVSRLENAPAPQRDTFAEEAIESLATALLTSQLVDDDAKPQIRSLLNRLGEAKTKNAREALKAELREELKPAVAAVSEYEPTQTNPELTNATERVFDFADAIGIERAAAIAALDGKWGLEPGETLSTAVTRLKGVLKAHAQNASTNARVAERKQAAGNGSPARTSAGYSNIDAAEDAYIAGDLSHEEYQKARKSFGVG